MAEPRKVLSLSFVVKLNNVIEEMKMSKKNKTLQNM